MTGQWASEIIGLADSYVKPGYHQVIWDGRDQYGREVLFGLYSARLITLEYSDSIKMVLLLK